MNIFDVFLISVCIYIYLSILLRIFGKKEFSQLNVFDFVVFLQGVKTWNSPWNF